MKTNKSQVILLFASSILLLASPVWSQAKAKKAPKAVPQAKPAAAAPTVPKRVPEPICLVLEPSVLKTKAAQPLPGARKTVLTPATETKDGLKLLTTEEITALGLDWQALQAKATEAASKHLKTLTPEISRDAQGVATYALLHSDCPFHTSILLCPEFGKQWEKEFGKDLIVLAPDRYSVYVFSRQTGDFQQFAARLHQLHTEATYPASAEAFSWSAEGLKAVGTLEPAEPKEVK